LGRVLTLGWRGLFAPAADPRLTFGPVSARHHALLADVHRARAELLASGERLQARAQYLEAALADLAGQATHATAGGRDDQARLALERRHAAAATLQTVRAQIDAIDKEVSRLTLVERRLAAQIESTRARHEIAAARFSAAAAEVRASEALAGVTDDLASYELAVEAVEASAEHMLARAAAIDSLLEAGVLGAAAAPEGGGLESEVRSRA
jgi:phage shock protein A